MVTRDAAYRRLLGLYPRTWREAHGDALLGVMLDAAEAEGRDRPSLAERGSAATHGLGARLDERFALGAAVTSTGLAAVALITFLIGAQGIAQMMLALVPWLAALALIALLRAKFGLAGLAALAGVAVTTLACTLAFTTTLSLSLAFDAADAGIPGTWFSRAWMIWFGAAWLTGAAAIAVIADGLLRAVRVPAAARLSASVIGGLVAAPFIGLSMISPVLTALIAVAVLILVVALGMPQRTAARGSAGADRDGAAGIAAGTSAGSHSASGPRAPASSGRRHAALAVAWFACVLSLLGVTYALTGSTWIANGPDGTNAMRLGIAAMALAGAVLVVAVALVAGGREPGRQRGIPLALIALGLALAAVGNVLGTAAAPMSPATLAAMLLLGLGLGSLIGFFRRGSVTQRWATSAAVALITAPLAFLLLPGVVFVVPLLAAAFAVWGTSAPRTQAPAGRFVPA